MKTSISHSQEIFLKKYKRKKHLIRFFQIFLFILLIASWEILARLQILDPFIFSSPSRMWNCMLELTKNGSLFYHIGITLAETFISFLLVTVLSILLAVLLWWNDMIASIAEPYLVVLNSLPKTALAPVFIVWLGNNMKTIVIAGISVAVFGSIITLYTQFQSVEEDKIKLILTLGGTKKDVLRRVVLPGNIPAILSNMKVNIGLSLVGVIIGEFLAANAGLGYLIIYGSQVFKLDYVMLSICILCIVATGLYKLLGFLEKALTSR
ncbi:MAG: ABC transporter permease [Lachnospiraceae bacterium]|nr:ABC transporter permease [Lachnospiraceae bacterium]